MAGMATVASQKLRPICPIVSGKTATARAMPFFKSICSRFAPAHKATINPKNSKFSFGRPAMNAPSPNSSAPQSASNHHQRRK